MNFLFLAAATLAQPLQGEYRRLPAVEFYGVEVGAAIELLAPCADLKYEIDPEVRGRVTLSARGVMPEDALRTVLGQARVAWSIRNGTLFVAPALPGSSRRPEPERPPVSDNLLEEPIPKMTLRKVKVADALANFMRPHSLSFLVEPGVSGSVTLSLAEATFEVGLQRIAREVNATYRVRSGVFTIMRRGGLRGGSPEDAAGV